MLRVQEFSDYWQALQELPNQDHYSKAQLCQQQFLLFSERGLDVYYAPFHFLNSAARVVVVGLTPGWTQMERAFWATKKGLGSGLRDEMLFREVAKQAAFSGPMRKNLVEMLDGIGLSRCLGIDSCLSLFAGANDLIHFTSLVSAPVFKAGENYRGASPRLFDTHKVWPFAVEHLSREMAALPHAMIMPLGKAANEGIQLIHRAGLIEMERCLIDLPHPSGANNGRRPTLFERGRRGWEKQLVEWFRRVHSNSKSRGEPSTSSPLIRG